MSWAQRAVAANRAPRAVVTSDNARARGWQDLVASCAQTAVAAEGLFAGPVAVAVVFRLPRPVSLSKRIRHHVTRPDIDKLCRCALDGMTGIVYSDDKSVIELRARKIYADDVRGPGAEVIVSEAAPPDPEQSDLWSAEP